MTLRPHRRQTWRPAAFTSADLWVLLGGLVAIASLRGFDYATGNDRVSQSLSIVEDAFPLPVWGAFTLVAAVVLAVGITVRVHALVFVGHGLLAGVYLALGAGVASSVAGMGGWWDGIRSGGDLLFFAALHAYLCVRTGPRPLPFDDAETTA